MYINGDFTSQTLSRSPAGYRRVVGVSQRRRAAGPFQGPLEILCVTVRWFSSWRSLGFCVAGTRRMSIGLPQNMDLNMDFRVI